MSSKYNSTDLICINPDILLNDPRMRNADIKTWGAYFLFYMHLWKNGGVVHKNISQFMHIFKVKNWSTARELYTKIAHLFTENNDLVYSNFVIKNIDDLTKFVERQRRNSYLGRQKRGISEQPGKNSGDLLPITTTTTTTTNKNNGVDEDLLSIIMNWNKVSRKTAPINKGDAALSMRDAAAGLMRKYSVETILESIANFGQARSLEHTQAFNWNLTNFLLKGYKKYLPGRFDIDHFDSSLFDVKKSRESDSPKAEKEDYEHF